MNTMADIKLPEQLTPERLLSMKVEDIFESEGLFQGMTQEPVVWSMVSLRRGADQDEYMFHLSYFGVRIGEVVVWSDSKTVRVEAM